jgi:solute carrier family 13 (sodium-dependent dicarboxylate transporter), member 2/3/5
MSLGGLDIAGSGAPLPRAAASRRGVYGLAGAIVVPLVLWFAPLGMSSTVRHALAVMSFMVIAWGSEAMDFALAGLIGCFLFWVLKVAPFGVAFGGFADETAWFIFGALILGALATTSGLARRLAYLVMRRIGATYPRVLLGLVITDFLLTALVPSGVARVVIMGSIALGLAQALGVGPGSNIGRGMFLIVTYAANIFDKMIIAGASAITARGVIEKVGGVAVPWSLWALAFLPCDIITVLVAWRLALWLFPPELVAVEGGTGFLDTELTKMGPWTAAETKAALLMGAALALWLTDSLHHVSPAAVGLGVALFALLPKVGVLPAEELRRVNYLTFVFVAAALGLGGVMVQTRSIDVLTDFFVSWMQPFLSNTYGAIAILYWSGFVYHIFLASEISMLATSMPVVLGFAKAHGLSPLVIGMIWTFSAGGKVFLYQSAVMIVGYSFGYFSARDLFKVGLLLTLIEFVILLALVPLYWPLIGIR